MFSRYLFRYPLRFSKFQPQESHGGSRAAAQSRHYKIYPRNFKTSPGSYRFDSKPFREATCKQSYWEKLTPEEKREHYKNEYYYGITIKGTEYKDLVGDCDIVLRDHLNLDEDKLTVGSVLEDKENGIGFIAVQWIISNKGTKTYYMTIPDDANISIGGDSWIRKYKSDKLIVRDITISDEDYASDCIKQLADDVPQRDANGCLYGSVY